MVKKDKFIVAVIVTYNRKELLKEALEALIRQDYSNLKILVVDNASTDGTKKYIDKYIKNQKVIYENTGANLGGAGGFNYGIKKAYDLNCDYVWVMDDDTIPKKDSLSKLLKVGKKLNYNFGFLASKVLWKDNSICKMNIQKTEVFKFNKDYKSEFVPVIVSSFVSMLIKKEVIEDVGLPIKDFFIWTDDWEYSRRISLKYKCFLVNTSEVIHKCKTNFGANIVVDDKSRIDRYKYAFRNEGYFYRREGFKGYMYLFLRQFYYLLVILFSKSKDKFRKIKIVFSCTWKGYNFNPKIEYVNIKK